MSLLLGCSFETILLIKKELRLKGLCMFVIIRFSTCQVKTFSPFVDNFAKCFLHLLLVIKGSNSINFNALLSYYTAIINFQ